MMLLFVIEIINVFRVAALGYHVAFADVAEAFDFAAADFVHYLAIDLCVCLCHWEGHNLQEDK